MRKNLDDLLDPKNIEKLAEYLKSEEGINEVKDFFTKKEACEGACNMSGHPKAKYYSSDPLRQRVWMECPTCGLYQRGMTSEEVRETYDLLHTMIY